MENEIDAVTRISIVSIKSTFYTAAHSITFRSSETSARETRKKRKIEFPKWASQGHICQPEKVPKIELQLTFKLRPRFIPKIPNYCSLWLPLCSMCRKLFHWGGGRKKKFPIFDFAIWIWSNNEFAADVTVSATPTDGVKWCQFNRISNKPKLCMEIAP